MRALRAELLRLPEGMKILPEDTREYTRQLEALPEMSRDLLVPRALLAVSTLPTTAMRSRRPTTWVPAAATNFPLR